MRAIPAEFSLMTGIPAAWAAAGVTPSLRVVNPPTPRFESRPPFRAAELPGRGAFEETVVTPASRGPGARPPRESVHGHFLTANLARNTVILGTAVLARSRAFAVEPQQRVEDIITLAKKASYGAKGDEIIAIYFSEQGRELSPVQAQQLADAMHQSYYRDWLLTTYAGYFSEAVSTPAAVSAPATVSAEVQHAIEMAALVPSTEGKFITMNGSYVWKSVGDNILYGHFEKNISTLNRLELKALTDAVQSPDIKAKMLAEYATAHAKLAPEAGVSTGTLVPAETPAEELSSAEIALITGSILLVPTLIVGMICYKMNANFRGLMQTGARAFLIPFTASRAAYETFQLKRSAHNAEKEKSKRRETLLRDIYTWEDSSDDVKRGKLAELIPLVMEIEDWEERNRALHAAVFQGFRDIRSAHYLKIPLMALAAELKHETKWRRDSAAYALRIFFSTHGLNVEEKRSLLGEITVLPAKATEDARHDVGVWKTEWEGILARQSASGPETDNAGERAKRAAPSGARTSA